MEKITALIVDDEELARENLEMLITSFCPTIQLVGKAINKEDAKIKIKNLNPQVVFLDICMPSGIEGLILLEEIENPDFLVVFVTAFKEYAVKAFNLNAVHYLLKPIDVDDLVEAGKKIESRLQEIELSKEAKKEYRNSIFKATEYIKKSENEKITICHTQGIKVVNQVDITYLKADGNCTILYFEDGTKYTDTRTLKVYEKLLSNQKFYRTHKSYIINSHSLKEFVTAHGAYALLTCGKEIPVSRTNLKPFRKWLKNL